MNYSYFLVKPDGIRFLDSICEKIEQKYESIRYYAVSDFEGIIKKLYHKHYERKGKKFAKSFDSYLYGLKEIFGNESVLILIGSRKKTYEDLMKSVLDTKLDIRNKYVNNNVGLITNYGSEQEYIRFLSPTGVKRHPRIMNDLGSYRISDLNIIHCPDMDKSTTLDELKILVDEGIIDDKNLITYSMIKKMQRYQTVRFQRDMKEENYKGESKPNISGWIKDNIDKGCRE